MFESYVEIDIDKIIANIQNIRSINLSHNIQLTFEI